MNQDNIKRFCEYLDISIEKYNDIVDSFVNTDNFKRAANGNWVLKEDRS